MYDHVYKWDHGEASVAYDGSGHIGMGVLNTIKAPCPQEEPGKYEITVKALDQNGIVIGVGKKARFFPEKK